MEMGRRTDADSRVQDLDDGLACIAHVGKSRSGYCSWDHRRETDGHFRYYAECPLCTNEQLRHVESSRRFARSASRLDHLPRGKDDCLQKNVS